MATQVLTLTQLEKFGGVKQAMDTTITKLEQAVKNPPNPIAFKDIKVGPELSIEYEPNEAEQVDTSNVLSRNLSPFVIQIEPPSVFKDLSNRIGTPTLDVNTYSSALGSRGSYQESRATLAATGFGTAQKSYGTVQEFLLDAAYYFQPAGKDIHLDNLGISDVNVAVDIGIQLTTLMSIPPLVLLINPSSFKVSYTKVQQFQDRTRYGYKLHTWGDEQVKVSITAVCGAFITGGRGLHAASRRDSKAWQNLMNLFHFYRNNGYIFDTVGNSNANHHVGALSLRYDQNVYYGNMESFQFGFEESKQLGGTEFSIEFVANYIGDLSTQTFNVLPMRGPIPNIEDQRYIGHGHNQPNHYTLGLDKNGFTFQLQGENVGVVDSFLKLVPQNTQNILSGGRTNSSSTQPVGSNGFVQLSGQETGVLTQTTIVTPFGF